MKSCRICQQEIPDKARMCLHCGSYQSIIRRFSSGAIATISLLIALVSVLGTYKSEIIGYFVNPGPRFIAYTKRINGIELYMEFLNQGSSAGIADYINCKSVTRLDEQHDEELRAYFVPVDRQLIKPNESKEYHYLLDSLYKVKVDRTISSVSFLVSTASACCGLAPVECEFLMVADSPQKSEMRSFSSYAIDSWLSKISQKTWSEIQQFCDVSMQLEICERENIFWYN